MPKAKKKRAPAGKRPSKKAAGKNAQKARDRTASDEPLVVYIHGIGDHPPKEELKLRWDLALFGRDMEERTRMAYWSDILHGDPKKRRRRARSAARRKRPLDAPSLLKEAKLTFDDEQEEEKARDFVESLAASLAEPTVAGPERRGIRTKFLPLPGFLRRPIAEKLLRWFVKDTASYFFDAKARKAIKARLEEQIPTGGAPFILVSHSQGTIVSFEVLSKLSQRADVALFATMGSPLGIAEVQDLMEEGGFELRIPRGVRVWHNFADRLDPVAIDAGLATDFEPRKTIQDHLVINERTKDLLRLNPHSSVGYLANPTVRSVVHHTFGFDPSARFIVARDVVEEFVGSVRRQPVLIEVLHPGYWALDESRKDLKTRESKQEEPLGKLSGRVDELAEVIKKEVRRCARSLGLEASEAEKLARVQKLRKYVSAHLTPEEIAWLAREHAQLNVYAVWRSAEKRKLVARSLSPIKVDAARRSYLAEGRGVTWAVLDTGIRSDHPHFAKGTIVRILDCTRISDAPIELESDRDPDGHGTHVAGIIAGEHASGKKSIRGIAPRAKLVVYKVLDENGFGEDAWIIKAIDDIYRRNDTGAGLQIHGVNLSLGGPFDATVYGCGHSPICADLRDLWRQGVLVCVAAGNEGQIQVLTQQGHFDLNTQLSIGDPANLEDCIAVGSVHTDKPHLFGVSHFSSRGPTADGRAKPDVVAPGERIRSANAGFRGMDFGELYRVDSGTSMACPHVSGLLAAFLSVRREFRGRPDEVKKILLGNCNDLARNRYHQGAGLPNLMKMLLNT